MLDGRGLWKKDLEKENYSRVLEWAMNNPSGTQKRCAELLGLNRKTVATHLKSAYKLKDLV